MNNSSEIKPLRIAAYLVSVLFFLFVLLFLSSKGSIEGTKIEEDGIALFGQKVKYPHYSSFFAEATDSLQADSTLDNLVASLTPLEDSLAVADSLAQADSLAALQDTVKKKVVIPHLSKIDYAKLERIQYPKSDPNFTADLHAAFMSKQCRILHYGDSQIEGDRISAYLRNRLQNMYDGGGPGFLPIKQVYHQISAVVEVSDNWLRYALFDPRNYKKTPHKRYGTFLSLSRFTPMLAKNDTTTVIDSLPMVSATISLGKTKKYYKKLKDFTHIGLHYGNVKSPTSIECFDGENLIVSDTLKIDSAYHEFSIDLPKASDNLKIVLKSKHSPDFYGVTLEKPNGIQLDNIAMRGNSGTVFSKCDWKSFAGMGKNLAPKVVILQFGGNTVPYLEDSTKVRWYGRNLVRQFTHLRNTLGKEIKFLFIGPTDMSVTVNGEMLTYPLLPYLNERLRYICLQNGVAYWSMFDAMGGEGSMPAWVEKGLVGNDHVHFTHGGTKIISELFFSTLYLDLKPHVANESH